MFYWRSTITDPAGGRPVEVAITDRSASTGEPPYTGLNLGAHVGDDPATVAVNRSLLALSLGDPNDRLVFMNQVHGTTVVEVSGSWATPVPEADAIISRTDRLALAVLVADCVPLLLHDARAGVIGAVHAGRPGLLGGIVPAAIDGMRQVGADRIAAVVGPSVCGRCYEVPDEMAAEAAGLVPSSAARSWTGTAAIDIGAGVVEQLAGAGVAVQWVPGCTRESAQLYSYRRDGTTGRFAGVIVLQAGGAA